MFNQLSPRNNTLVACQIGIGWQFILYPGDAINKCHTDTTNFWDILRVFESDNIRKAQRLLAFVCVFFCLVFLHCLQYFPDAFTYPILGSVQVFHGFPLYLKTCICFLAGLQRPARLEHGLNMAWTGLRLSESLEIIIGKLTGSQCALASSCNTLQPDAAFQPLLCADARHFSIRLLQLWHIVTLWRCLQLSCPSRMPGRDEQIQKGYLPCTVGCAQLAGTRGCDFAISDYVYQPTHQPLEFEYTIIGFKSNIVWWLLAALSANAE